MKGRQSSDVLIELTALKLEMATLKEEDQIRSFRLQQLYKKLAKFKALQNAEKGRSCHNCKFFYSEKFDELQSDVLKVIESNSGINHCEDLGTKLEISNNGLLSLGEPKNKKPYSLTLNIPKLLNKAIGSGNDLNQTFSSPELYQGSGVNLVKTDKRQHANVSNCSCACGESDAIKVSHADHSEKCSTDLLCSNSVPEYKQGDSMHKKRNDSDINTVYKANESVALVNGICHTILLQKEEHKCLTHVRDGPNEQEKRNFGLSKPKSIVSEMGRQVMNEPDSLVDYTSSIIDTKSCTCLPDLKSNFVERNSESEPHNLETLYGQNNGSRRNPSSSFISRFPFLRPTQGFSQPRSRLQRIENTGEQQTSLFDDLVLRCNNIARDINKELTQYKKRGETSEVDNLIEQTESLTKSKGWITIEDLRDSEEQRIFSPRNTTTATFENDSISQQSEAAMSKETCYDEDNSCISSTVAASIMNRPKAASVLAKIGPKIEWGTLPGQHRDFQNLKACMRA